MPGILYHLSFANKVYKKLNKSIKLDKIDFFSGNLIPDLATDKSKSHYRKKSSVDKFYIPDMCLVKKDLFKPSNSLIFGMYCHLYLDYYFIEEFLIPQFIWNSEKDEVINKRNNKCWTSKVFFSNSGMYGSYTEINHLLIRDGHIPQDIIEEIPEILPNTKVDVFDKRCEKTWKKELEEYLKQKKDYTSDVFDYQDLCNYIEKIASQFAQEVLN